MLNPSTREAETGRSLALTDQPAPGLQELTVPEKHVYTHTHIHTLTYMDHVLIHLSGLS